LASSHVVRSVFLRLNRPVRVKHFETLGMGV
jgi:hypothetical protein